MRDRIQVGYQAFTNQSKEEFGAIREITPKGVTVYVENAGDFTVPLDAIESVVAQKVIFKADLLDDRLLDAIGHAHDAEEPEL